MHASILSRTARALFLLILLAMVATATPGQTKRLVVIKLDGLPNDIVDRFVRERDPRTGKSQLPWIEHIFYERGTRLANFYVRGLSLSAPSWSLLDTGQHLQIKGNVEFDRYTLESYDYLNYLPFMVGAARKKRVDTQTVEVLDSVGIPLLIDAYPIDERYGGLSLYQRGPRYVTFGHGFVALFRHPPKELFDEWTMGDIELGSTIFEGMFKELMDRIENPKVRYLSILIQDFDHTAHRNRDREAQLGSLKRIDLVLGRIWTEIQKSTSASDTAMVIVSDHGMNSDEKIFSQGYNVVKFLSSAAGGGHHVITKRRLLMDYSIKAYDPFIPLVTTTSPDSYYLKGQGDDYPTVMLDFDGNERASLQFRDSDLNVLQILFQQLQRTDLSPKLRSAVNAAFFATLERRRAEWGRSLEELNRELGALRRSIVKERELWNAQPKKFTREESALGIADASRRIYSQLDRWSEQEKDYSAYARVLANLLALRKDTFDVGKIKIEDVIPRHAMGEQNSIHQFQNYVVGVSAGGLKLSADGSLDTEKCFQRIDYFSLFEDVAVRNNVQNGIGNRPIDFIAIRISSSLVQQLAGESEPLAHDAVWLYGGPEQQALILAREDRQGQLSFRYLPVKNLKQNADGRIQFESIAWQSGLPLRIFEDQNLDVATTSHATWLSQWHTDTEWLHAVHRTQYSNGVIGLYEELARQPAAALATDDASLADDEKLMRQFVQRQRRAIEPDLLLFANNHWNFDVRGFNPGGNHGAFFRISTHSTWMIAGGERTGIPRGMVVDEPYDSLSFVPTLLALTGSLRDDMSPLPVLWDKGFRAFPGRVVRELVPLSPPQRVADEGAVAGPK